MCRTCGLFLVAAWLLSLPGAVLGDTLAERVARAAREAPPRVGAMAVRLDRGQTLFATAEDERFIPASNMKLLTTAAAVEMLGPAFVFETRLVRRRGEDGRVRLRVEGGGDPAFGDRELLKAQGLNVEPLLQKWVAVVKEAGIERVAALTWDDRIFDRELVHPTWPREQLNRWYCAPVSGLNFHDNCIDVFPMPGEPGGNARAAIRPAAPFLDLRMRARSGSENRYGVSRPHGTSRFTLRGEVAERPEEPVAVTVPNPPRFFVRVLAHRLEEAGVEVDELSRAPAKESPDARTLFRVRTAMPLVLRRSNKDSQNLFAEALLKRMGHERTGEPGSWDNGARALKTALKARVPAGTLSAVRVADGSGLSRENRVTPRALVAVLRSMGGASRAGRLYRESLATGGEDGTLKNRFRGPLAGRVRGKSGYIDGVVTLSGYYRLPGSSEPTAAFSILVNEIEGGFSPRDAQKLQARILRMVDEALRAEGEGASAR
jgi:D-alanyl-D-alanine carboxypeptidase/D-alanyl-D-alanine-endopeptidase (penicillin-binding protein 4)